MDYFAGFGQGEYLVIGLGILGWIVCIVFTIGACYCPSDYGDGVESEFTIGAGC
jgi:hypothetical protein